jgi:hypothetical protein
MMAINVPYRSVILKTFLSLGLSVCTLAAQTTPVPLPAVGDPLYAPIAAAPENAHQKLIDLMIVTMGPHALFAPAFSAAIRMANPPDQYPRAWKDGAGAYGRNFGASLASRTSLETGRYVTGALLHEDFRYRPSTSTRPAARFFHAVAFAVVDKSDSGHNRLAVANFVGAGAGGFVGELYLPKGYNNLSHAEAKAAFEFGGMMGQNVLREFAPDLARITRKLKLPFPRVPIPEWWTPLDHK